MTIDRRMYDPNFPEKVTRMALLTLPLFTVYPVVHVRVEESQPAVDAPTDWDITLSFIRAPKGRVFTHPDQLTRHRLILRVDIITTHVRSARVWQPRKARS